MQSFKQFQPLSPQQQQACGEQKYLEAKGLIVGKFFSCAN
jgi:hypothetical protein